MVTALLLYQLTLGKPIPFLMIGEGHLFQLVFQILASCIVSTHSSVADTM